MSDDYVAIAQRSDTELDLALQEVWQRKRELSEAAALICSELFRRILEANTATIAGWSTMYIMEDMSHDLPHAHVRIFTDSGGEVMADRRTPSWPLSRETTDLLDDIAFQLYTLASDLFIPHPLPEVLDSSERVYLVHKRAPHA